MLDFEGWSGDEVRCFKQNKSNLLIEGQNFTGVELGLHRRNSNIP